MIRDERRFTDGTTWEGLLRCIMRVIVILGFEVLGLLNLMNSNLVVQMT
jgi:hypothetical protein